jgi:hypothetical protein
MLDRRIEHNGPLALLAIVWRAATQDPSARSPMDGSMLTIHLAPSTVLVPVLLRQFDLEPD